MDDERSFHRLVHIWAELWEKAVKGGVEILQKAGTVALTGPPDANIVGSKWTRDAAEMWRALQVECQQL